MPRGVTVNAASPIPLRVECYAGYRAEERPQALWLYGRRIAIREILDRWCSEEYAYFELLGEDGVRYLVRRDDHRDGWEVTRMDVSESPEREAGH